MNAEPQRNVLAVCIDAPLTLALKAEWVLRTLFAALGAELEIVRERDRANGCVLACATEPIDGLPTLPLAPAALDLFAEGAALPPGSFARFATAHGPLTGCFPVEDPGFALPFDLISSAFLLLACWDEFTTGERDQHGRFPFAASFFASEQALFIGQPPVDAYLPPLRAVVDARLREMGRPALANVGWGGEAGPAADPAGEAGPAGSAGPARFALALTHDVDGLKRWTARGWLAAGKRTVGAARHGDWARTRFEVGGVAHALTRDIPRGEDPFWTFPQLLAREDALGASSTFFLLTAHSHPTDGTQPGVYHKRLPRLLRLLSAHDREVGLHGNHRDGRELDALREDRAALAERAAAAVEGVRFHYLKCTYHDTLPMLDEAGLAYDSSLAFAEREGLRCGFSHPFHPYEVRRDSPLELVELPLAVMDSSLQEKKYRGLDAAGAGAAARAVLERLRDAGGAAAILWHHNRFHEYVGRGYGDVYWELLDWAEREGGVLLPAGEAVRLWRARAGETTL